MGKLVQVTKTVTRGRNRKVRKTVKASKVLKKAIQKEINKNVETKYYRALVSTAIAGLVDTTAERLPDAAGVMAKILQGDTVSTRSGNVIRVKSLSLKFRCTAIAAGTSAVIYLIKYSNCNGLAPTIADIWTDVTDLANSPRVIEKMDDYAILGKVDIKIGPGGSTNRLYSLNKSFKGAGLKVQYDANADDATSVESNNLYYVVQSSVADDVITLNGYYTLKYTDI